MATILRDERLDVIVDPNGSLSDSVTDDALTTTIVDPNIDTINIYNEGIDCIIRPDQYSNGCVVLYEIERERVEQVGGELTLYDVERPLNLPLGSGIDLYVDCRDANIDAILTGPAQLSCENGDISIVLDSALEIELRGCKGKTKVYGLQDMGNGTYTPTDCSPDGEVVIYGGEGNVEVRYSC